MPSIAVISNDILFGEFLEKGIPAGIQVIQLNEPGEINQYPSCHSFFDLAFEPNYERLQTFEALFPRPVFINCVHLTNKDLNEIAGYSPGLPGPGNIVRI